MFGLAYIATATTLASLLAHAVADPGIFEVDLVFPRNETYAPVPLMPVVFALQNPALAAPLDAHISWSTFEYGNISSAASWSHRMDLRNLNASLGSSYLSASYIPSLQGIESTWVFSWILSTGNCSQTGGDVSSSDQANSVIFTTSNTSQAPNLEAATNTCNTTGGFAFNVTAVEQVSLPQNFYGQSSCAVLGLAPTSRSPCAVPIDNTAASSVSADISLSRCTATSSSCTAIPTSVKSGVEQTFKPATWGPVALSLLASLTF